MIINPAPIVYEYEQKSEQKITEVKSCSDCCMTNNPDGTPNLIGQIHRASLTVTRGTGPYAYSYLNCQNCPVYQNQSDEDWNNMLNEIDGTE